MNRALENADVNGAPGRATTGELDLAYARLAALEQLLEVHEQTSVEQAESLERAQADLKRVFMQAPAAIATTRGPMHVFETVNPLFLKIAGDRPFIGRSIREALPELEGQPFFGMLDGVYRDGRAVTGDEVPAMIDRAGTGMPEPAYFNFVYQPLFAADEHVMGIMIHAVDVTDQVRARQGVEKAAAELQRLTTALERSNTDLDQFAYVASHDLKAPLRGIANLTQWIEDDLTAVLTGETRNHMALLKGRVHRMEALIDGILAYSRAGRAKGQEESVDVGQMLRDAVELMQPAAHVQIRIGPMPTMLTDRVQLQQILMNLIANAIKHNSSPQPTIDVTATEASGECEFAVADNGPGIAPEYHERIWQIFQTLVPRDKVEGTGIGLSLVKKIVEGRGGHVSVDSAVGEGSTFRFTWPATSGTET